MYVCLSVCECVFVVHKTWIFQKVWFIICLSNCFYCYYVLLYM